MRNRPIYKILVVKPEGKRHQVADQEESGRIILK
jgi:hypothetical protein